MLILSESVLIDVEQRSGQHEWQRLDKAGDIAAGRRVAMTWTSAASAS